MSTTRTAVVPAVSRPAAYLALTKPDVSFLVVMTSFAGFILGSRSPVDFARLAHTVFGTTLVAAGTAALNHFIERASDARMRRTSSRPLPSGQLHPREALWFGASLVAVGAIYLAVAANALACLLALLTTATYLGLYTPLKKKTTLATLVGAFPGAVPPLVGWAAARGSLSLEAWVLYAVLFLWQFPHFFTIAWIYREDYARAGIRMLPVVDTTGAATFRQSLIAALLLVPVSVIPALTGHASPRYFFGAIVLGLLLVQACLWAARTKSNTRAKWLMHATVIHLPLLLGLMIYDRFAP
jgi:protoheme IX farnesyltransferase